MLIVFKKTIVKNKFELSNDLNIVESVEKTLKMKLSFLIFLSFQTTLLWAANVPVYINTKVGRFKGTQYDYLNATIQEFKGIRFGQPPLGVLRFAKPIPADPLPNITLDATKYGPICTQYLDPGEWITSEDCLFLNIWTTKSKKVTFKNFKNFKNF